MNKETSYKGIMIEENCYCCVGTGSTFWGSVLLVGDCVVAVNAVVQMNFSTMPCLVRACKKLKMGC